MAASPPSVSSIIGSFASSVSSSSVPISVILSTSAVTSSVPLTTSSTSTTTSPSTSTSSSTTSTSAVQQQQQSTTNSTTFSSTSSTAAASTTANATISMLTGSSAFSSVGGPAGLAGIITASSFVIVMAIVLITYLIRRGDGKGKRKSKAESKRSTLLFGSRVGPWRLNVSGTPSPDDNWDARTNRKSRRTTANTVHKDFPEIVVLDARPSTDNSATSLPYAAPSTFSSTLPQGPLHLTMPFTPPEGLQSPVPRKSQEELPPERYIPYVAPESKRQRPSSSHPQPRRASLGQLPTGPQTGVRWQPGTNSVSAAVPASQRTSMVMPNHPYGQASHHARSSSASAIHSMTMPPEPAIPPKGTYHPRYHPPPHNSPATVAEETESELGEDREVDMTDVDSKTSRDRTIVMGDDGRPARGELFRHMHEMGEWDSHSRNDGDSIIDPEQRVKPTEGRFAEEWRRNRF